MHRLKADFPALEVIVNGGLRTPAEAAAQLAQVDGVMLGRAAYHDPYGLVAWERLVYGAAEPPPEPRRDRAAAVALCRARARAGTPLNAITRHILGLFNGQRGARAWRRHLSEAAHRPGAGPRGDRGGARPAAGRAGARRGGLTRGRPQPAPARRGTHLFCRSRQPETVAVGLMVGGTSG